MTPHRRLEELDAKLAPYEEPSFAAGRVALLIAEIDRFATEIMHNQSAPNAGVFAREIRVNCQAARGVIEAWRKRMLERARA
jgi:hypothetical protein